MVKRFVADIGISRAFRPDNGAEYHQSTLVDYCNGHGIRRELTVPNTPQQKYPVESVLKCTLEGHQVKLRCRGLAARLEMRKFFLDIHLEQLKDVRDPTGKRSWSE